MPSHLLHGEGCVLRVRAFIDGASRGNPGPAGYGVHLTRDDGIVITARGFLGETTNNVAEYSGLIEALNLAIDEGAEEVDIASDSLLLVQQMRGNYRVKHPNLKPLWAEATRRAHRFRRFSIRHVYREENKLADRLANEAIDMRDERVVVRSSEEG